MSTPSLPRGELLAVVALHLACLGLTLADPLLGTVDPEEGVNAAQAVLLDATGPRGLFRYQYAAVCGGCTLTAVTANLLGHALGEGVGVWKLGLVPFTLAALVAQWTWVRPRHGALAGALLAVLWALPSALASGLALRGWANHLEATCVALVAAVLLLGMRSPRGVMLAGVVAGLALWIGWTSLAVLLPALAVGGRAAPRRTAAAMGVALWPVLPWTVLRLVEGRDASDVLERVAWSRQGLPLLPKALDLFTVGRLDAILGGSEAASGTGAAAAVGIAVAAAGVVATRDRLGLVLLGTIGTWIVLYLPGPAELGPTVAPAWFHQRYAVPLALAVPGLAATGAAAWWSRGRRALAVAVALAVLPTPVVQLRARLAQAEGLEGLARTEAASWTWFRHRSLVHPAATSSALRCAVDDRRCLELEGYRAGVEAGGRGVPLQVPLSAARRAWLAGVGAAVGVRTSPDALVATLVARLPEAGSTDRELALAEALVVAGPDPVGLDLGVPLARTACVAAWARAHRTTPRFSLRRSPPPSAADAQRAWAYGAGQADGARHGAGVAPPEGLSAEAVEDFRSGAAEAEVRSWMLLWDPARSACGPAMPWGGG